MSFTSKPKIILSVAAFASAFSSTSYFAMASYANVPSVPSKPAIVSTSPTPPVVTQSQVVLGDEEEKTKAAEDKKDLLLETIASITKNSNGTVYSVGIIDLKTSQAFGQEKDRATHAASTMKLLVAVSVYYKIESGDLALDKNLSGGTVLDHLKRMINRSDNGSWDILASEVGLNKLQENAEKWGMVNTNLDENAASAADLANLLSGLYQDKLISVENKDQLYGFMQNTETENYLTPAFPKGTVLYHKTGHYGGGMHDAMIVDKSGNPFVIVVMTSNDRGVIGDRTGVFKDIGQAVYDYFN